ncbi:MAG: peptidoglycan DD-metalloendopeptidase family protein, partial [Gemmatimonadetes bacterium]|nr:peptidoglycan DD-metalloendopeptidase family protein [Gemmatimonadota bacterium]NIQ52551.1 peptidoglycan DD-metalloendopeptidase family protein [Gemmatimonadota bacterium]NIU72689.1 peptidoglycan DD-metalloendopeptidase family protein [Gammaproteobacteria bacterium]NIX43095.1 peptidoglycan DD-metalloendopeptidase family protein [Gemmatimonadota bacterium]NIY07257.1 peptidoglycan DD-metalloendopeptidase family protein [Gemmatimonadota bacterium]
LWHGAARRALDDAPTVSAPFSETGYLDPARPEAVAYRFPAREGQRLVFELRLEPSTNALVFLDLFRAAPDDGALVRVASADSGATRLGYEPDRDADYVIRIQPELLRGGRYVLTATAAPTMSFPVEGGALDDVGSFFGDARDGGRRDHHGIDIFAPRGTPVVAAVEGRVSRVRTTPIGGRVVWLRDARRRQSIYYAHLDEQLVASGTRVRPGDTLGLVGNSGNARTTPPHLHFGIYRRGRGPLDPLPFVEPLPSAPPAPYPAEPGRWRRVIGEDVRLRAAPDSAAAEVGRLDREVPLRVDAIAGDWLRVAVPDGRRGFLAGRLTEPVRPIRSAFPDSVVPLRDGPQPDAVEVARVGPGTRIDVLGRLGDHLYVRAGDRDAWLSGGATR